MLTSSIFFALIAAASARRCKDITVPVSLTATNAVFDLKAPTTKIEVSNLFLNIARQGSNYPASIQKGTARISGNYKLAATYCEPDSGPGSELQILTHGAGFDRSYWDFSHNHYNYSYVEKAVDEHGYSTFTWDRLGIGHSSKGDPVQEIQAFLEVAALHELSSQLRQGKLKGVSAKFDKILHVGHSFGSVLTYTLANMAPELTDAIVLTGFSQVFNFIPLFAVGNNFVPAKDIRAIANQYPKGYVATEDSVGWHLAFFSEGDFDPEVLDIVAKTGQPAAPGELLTVGATVMTESAYTGRVLVITGEKDLPFCGGDCYSTAAIGEDLPSLLDVSKKYFPHASCFNATVVPGAGHGLNYLYSHTLTYNSIFDFLSE
ncbi:Fc.00g107770.m01.CDS01 [Cosmosporella sp. VM-42]